jgi:hypothetical protein
MIRVFECNEAGFAPAFFFGGADAPQSASFLPPVVPAKAGTHVSSETSGYAARP